MDWWFTLWLCRLPGKTLNSPLDIGVTVGSSVGPLHLGWPLPPHPGMSIGSSCPESILGAVHSGVRGFRIRRPTSACCNQRNIEESDKEPGRNSCSCTLSFRGAERQQPCTWPQQGLAACIGDGICSPAPVSLTCHFSCDFSVPVKGGPGAGPQALSTYTPRP